MPVENCIHTVCTISVAQSYLVWNWPSKSIGVASIFFMIAFVIVIWLVVLYDCCLGGGVGLTPLRGIKE